MMKRRPRRHTKWWISSNAFIKAFSEGGHGIRYLQGMKTMPCTEFDQILYKDIWKIYEDQDLKTFD